MTRIHMRGITRVLILIIILQACTVSYAIPSSYSNYEYIANIENQIDNACVAYAVANAIETQMKIEGYEVPKNGFDKSWFYKRAKELDGHDGVGTYADIVLEIAKTEGIKEKNGSKRYKIEHYQEIEPTVNNIKKAISNGYVVIVGSGMEGNNWYNSNGNILPTNAPAKEQHMIYLTGFNNDVLTSKYTGYFEGVNSWGTSWGDKGKFKMAYEYAEEKIDEAWIFEIKSQKIQVDINSENTAVDDKIVYNNDPTRPENEVLQVAVPLIYILEKLGYHYEWNKTEHKLIIDNKFTQILGVIKK